MITPQRVKSIQADDAVFNRVLEDKRNSIFPVRKVTALLKILNHLMFINPLKQSVDILKMIIERVPCQITVICNHLNMDFVYRVTSH